jgi:Ca2+-binding RTX toxin-like protein
MGGRAPQNRVRLGLLLAIATLLIVPSSAHAAASSVSTDLNFGTVDVAVNGGDTAPHAITVSYSAGSWLIMDSAGVSAGTGCAAQSGTAATCADHPNIDGVTVQGGAGNDTITISSLSPTSGTSGRFTTATGLFAGAGNDIINGSAIKDLIRAGDGNDMIDGGLGADGISGQRGNDTLTYANRPASQPVYVNLQRDIDDIAPPAGSFGGAEGDGPDVENVIGTPGNDTILGFNSGVSIYDSSAANTFRGGAGNDLLSGLEGGDKLIGETGNDRLLGGAQKDVTNGGAGRDRCSGGKAKDKGKKCERETGIP